MDSMKKLRFMRSVLTKGMIHLNLQILYQCNFKCKICDFWKEPYKNMPMLSVKQTEVAFGKLEKRGPLIVSVGGGEPLLHPELIEIIEIIAKNNFPVMITNGWFMTPEKAKAIWKAGMYEVSVSLDFADPKKHDAMRNQKGAFQKAVESLQQLYKNRVYPHQRIHMITTVMEENIDEIEDLIKLSRDIGVTYLVSCYSSNRGNVTNKKSGISYGEKLLELKRKYSQFVSVSGYLSQFTRAIEEGGVRPCFAGKNLFNIDCQGNVTLCIDRLDDIAGNILDDNIDEIMENLVTQQKENDCTECWTSCRGPIESMLYGRNKVKNIIDNYHLVKDIPLCKSV
jgi:MoaA/NifB/PqqE/SkfB family radical SAM enzyme